ncbi:MAG: cellulase family glycosylhydrolase [Bacteroidales bacterium]|nr:carboxypeptidase-like regulatory domain-containing protein [Bacteroidales bacterium]NLB85632.1 cellulase family glycosylhydrolase [Bacteroidales bacterium]
MKKTLIIIYIVFISLISCNTRTLDSQKQARTQNKNFIYLENNYFKLNDDSVFLYMLNYIVDLREINDELVFSTHIHYEDTDSYEYDTKEESLNQLNAHFQLIKNLGFNSIRICFDRLSQDIEERFFIETNNEKYYVSEYAEEIIFGLKELIELAKKHDLKVMLLIKPPIKNKELEDFTIKILHEFKDEPTIFAYDFINEPLYFDPKPDRPKIEVYSIVSHWQKLVRTHAPNQLFTIGFSEPIEVFSWDAYILPVDFIQIHTYHPLRVPNEIWWYSKYMNKPFMVGETALPADNDSISYEEQRQFMIDAYKYTVDCGGIGFAWWDFQETIIGAFEVQYTGLLNHQGKTLIEELNYEIKGSIKPAAYELKNLKSYKKQKPEPAVNYFNMIGNDNICVKGKVIDQNTKQAIEGAVVRGWNQHWDIGMNTYTDENGEFTLYSNDENVYFTVSAPGMSRFKLDTILIYTKISTEDFDFYNLPNQKLEYHKIAYHPFLKNPASFDLDTKYPIFNFDEALFSNAKFVSDLGVIELKKLYIPLYLEKIKLN